MTGFSYFSPGFIKKYAELRDYHYRILAQLPSFPLPQEHSVSASSFTAARTKLRQYTIEVLKGVYHDRWGIEELYKVSKTMMEVNDFHGRSERAVKQELQARHATS